MRPPKALLLKKIACLTIADWQDSTVQFDRPTLHDPMTHLIQRQFHFYGFRRSNYCRERHVLLVWNVFNSQHQGDFQILSSRSRPRVVNACNQHRLASKPGIAIKRYVRGSEQLFGLKENLGSASRGRVIWPCAEGELVCNNLRRECCEFTFACRILRCTARLAAS